MSFHPGRIMRAPVRERIDLIYWDSGGGIRCDASILQDYLESEGYDVGRLVTRDRSNKFERLLKLVLQGWKVLSPSRLQIHLEQIHPEQFRFSRNNVLIPNPEFTDPKVLPKLGPGVVIACKTRQAEALLGSFGKSIRYIGFTSNDMYRENHAKDYGRFLHLAGRSQLKGTMEILEAWKAHPEWPVLTLVWTPDDAWGNPRRTLEGADNINLIQERVSEELLLELVNTHGVHLCPSRTEGFGHYIVEALSAASVVVTTNAPPMNELVSPEYGYLAEAQESGKQFMNTLYRVSPASIEDRVAAILEKPPETLARMGQRAREWYLENDRQFKERFGKLVRDHTGKKVVGQ